jgi:hypothetical protein
MLVYQRVPAGYKLEFASRRPSAIQCSCLASTFVWMDLPAFYLGLLATPRLKRVLKIQKTSPRLNWPLQAIHHVPSSNRSNVQQWKMPLGRAIQNIPIPSHEIPVGWKRFPNPVGEFTISKELGDHNLAAIIQYHIPRLLLVQNSSWLKRPISQPTKV